MKTAKTALLVRGKLWLPLLTACCLLIRAAGADAITTNVLFGGFVGSSFSPPAITVHVGDTIIWTNTGGGGFHTVSGTGAESLCGPGIIDTTCSHTFANAGTFAYQCNNHAFSGMIGSVTVLSAQVSPPTVTITNPVSGAVFAAPANVAIFANAASSGGTITNVQFFSNGAPLGSVTAPPYNLTANSLVAGSYSLTAKASDNGGQSTTSAPVSISVVAPVSVSNFNARVTGNQFVFNHTANPGLRYVVENTVNLTNWSPVVTNTAVSNSVQVSDTFQVGGLRFYRVGRLPNPQ